MTETDAETPAVPVSTPRRWDWRPKLRWFAAEIVVVVAGVLIALALNAWWGDRQKALDTRALRGEIRADVEQTREVLARDFETSREAARKARANLAEMATPGADRDSVLATVGSVFVLKKWEPANDTYAEALGSGRLNLITDPGLRLALSRYHSQIENVGATVDFFTKAYYGQQEPWMVANTVYSEVAYDLRRGELVQGPFRTDFDALAQSRELWNLLTLRLELEVGYQDFLEELDQRAVTVLHALDR